ncbi:glucans biosynthesis protein MdoC [Hafnia alvei]|uniref:glucans biosynthesis protein MdoC n=1 Tax=Hafnia alvei TaxID=569 RepID=UPI0021CDDC1F|nr:glucans biosynthesis protein MdoC [Hafnia alvei]
MAKTIQREHYLDYIRATLMLLGIPFHVSLVYSAHHWVVNSTPESLTLSLFNDFIHAFRMQVFFVISGYFSCMLYQRYPLKKWLNVRLTRLLIPMAAAMVLITLPQFWYILHHTSGIGDWDQANVWQKANICVWYLVSHLWFLLTLSLLTVISAPLLNAIVNRGLWSKVPTHMLLPIFIALGVVFAVLHKLCATFMPGITGSALFNFLVVNTLMYFPFYLLGAVAFVHIKHKENITRVSFSDGLIAAASVGLYLLNENTQVFAPLQLSVQFCLIFIIGLTMTKVVLTLGHRLLNRESRGVTYFVGASLFIYLVHHPLTIIYGSLMENAHPNPFVGFIIGVTLVVLGSLALYEIHRRVPLLRYLFSGKPQKPVVNSLK